MIDAPKPVRGVRLRAIAAACAALALAGCSSTPRLAELTTAAGLPPQVELTATPFHPQSDQQCGPAALATLLGASGRETPPQALAREIFLPGRRGSLQPELLGALRARGLLPYVLEGDLDAVLAELAAGRPVLVLQRQGFGPWPAWHYAVAIGYDTARGSVLLRSGTTQRLELGASVFEATWARADRWAVVALEPGALPARPDVTRYMLAAAGLEAVGQGDAALAAYRAASSRWPDEPLPVLGLANLAAARGAWRDAALRYREVLQLQPGHAAAINNLAEALGRLGCKTQARAVLLEGNAHLAADEPLRAALARTLAELDARPDAPPAETATCAEIAAR